MERREGEGEGEDEREQDANLGEESSVLSQHVFQLNQFIVVAVQHLLVAVHLSKFLLELIELSLRGDKRKECKSILRVRGVFIYSVDVVWVVLTSNSSMGCFLGPSTSSCKVMRSRLSGS